MAESKGKPNYRLKSVKAKKLINEEIGILSIANIQNGKTISRRDFIKASGILMAALGVSQLLGGCGGGGGEGGDDSESWKIRAFNFQPSHMGNVNSLAFSPDGTRIVSGSDDNKIKIWNTLNGDMLLTLNGQEGGVNTVAFSPDGLQVASAGSYVIKICDTYNGNLLLTISTDQIISFIAWSMDGTKIASYNGSFTINIYDAVNGNLNLSIRDDDYVYPFAFSPDGTKIASGGKDNIVKIWDALNGNLIQTLKGHSGDVKSVAFSPDGTKIASVSNDETLKIWDTVTGDLILTFDNEDKDIYRTYYLFISIFFSFDGDKIAIVYDYDRLGRIMIKILNSFDGSLISQALIDANTGVPINMRYSCIVDFCILSPSWSMFAVAVSKGLIQVWKSIDMKAFNIEYLLIDSTLPREENYEYSVLCGGTIPSWFPPPCSCDCVCTCDTVPTPCSTVQICTCDLVCTCVPVYY